MKLRLLLMTMLISFMVSAFCNEPKTFSEGRSPLPPSLYICDSISAGVSDAGMDSATARKMAIRRALFMHALSHGAEIKTMTDMYSVSNVMTNTYDFVSEKCLTLANVYVAPVTYRYDITEEYVSDRGETFVFIKVCEDGDSCITISAECDFMSSYRNESHEKSEYKTLMSITSNKDSKSDTMFYSVKGVLDNPMVSSQLGDYEKFISKKSFWYDDEGDVSKSIEAKSYTMKNGMWCAMVQSLCYSIVNIIYSQSYVKNISESYKDKVQDLSREVTVSRLSFNPEIIGIRNNNICINWNMKHLQ